MKKITAIVAAMALAACGGNDVEETDAGMADNAGTAQPTAPVTPTAAGTYVGTDENGQEWTSQLNADGTYQDTMGGEVTETGSWTERNGQTCFLQDIVEGDPAAEENCWTLSTPDAQGNVTITNAEGEEMTIRKQMS